MDRFQINKDLKGLVKTGDIFFRLGSEKLGPVSFGNIIAKLSGSDFSHCSIALVEDEIYLIEVHTDGTKKLRLIDWIPLCEYFAIYRPNNQVFLKEPINAFLDDDPDYDFKFSLTGNEYYCTESIVKMYRSAGLNWFRCRSVKEIITNKWYRYLFYLFNWLSLVTWKRGITNHLCVYDLKSIYLDNHLHQVYDSRGCYYESPNLS